MSAVPSSLRALLGLFFLALLPLGTSAQHDHASHPGVPHDEAHEGFQIPERTQPWTPATLAMAARIPVQDFGRVKPLSTFAGFTMLRLNGKRSLKTPEGEKLTPTAWMLDVMYFPLQAAKYEVFLVENDEVITAIGLSFPDKKKRDHYSYNELTPGLERLMELAAEYYNNIEEKDRSNVQQQIVILGSNVRSFLNLVNHMGYAEVPIPVAPEIQDIFDQRAEVLYHDVLPHVSELRKLNDGDDPVLKRAAFGTLSAAAQLAEVSRIVALVPPDASVEDEAEWMTPGELFQFAMAGEEISDRHIELLAGLSEMAEARTNPKGFESALSSFLAQSQAMSEVRGEYDKIPLEVTYYNAGLLMKSLIGFLLTFVVGAVLWFRPKNKTLYIMTGAGATLSTLLLVTAITMRCIIRGRPPISTLYETLLFVAATGSIVALAVELMNKKRVALTMSIVIGSLGLFLANKYEVIDKQDTMPSLVAVLDTNFWLATHVTCITLGYSAGMLAAFMASFYLIAKMLGFKAGDRGFYSGLSRMVYGIICFAVIFSTVGTILGGVWANDSWGRFWGWDPKENGALLIVLSQLAILHGRMGGYLREHGVCMAAAFGGTIIAFSWFGVNLLGVGLHSYGFTSGIAKALWTYYYVQWGIVALGGVTWLIQRQMKAQATA